MNSIQEEKMVAKVTGLMHAWRDYPGGISENAIQDDIQEVMDDDGTNEDLVVAYKEAYRKYMQLDLEVHQLLSKMIETVSAHVGTEKTADFLVYLAEVLE